MELTAGLNLASRNRTGVGLSPHIIITLSPHSLFHMEHCSPSLRQEPPQSHSCSHYWAAQPRSHSPYVRVRSRYTQERVGTPKGSSGTTVPSRQRRAVNYELSKTCSGEECSMDGKRGYLPKELVCLFGLFAVGTLFVQYDSSAPPAPRVAPVSCRIPPSPVLPRGAIVYVSPARPYNSLTRVCKRSTVQP